MSAEFDKGVLQITVPKPEQRKPRRIQIAAGGGREGQPAVEGTATERSGNGAGAAESQQTAGTQG